MVPLRHLAVIRFPSQQPPFQPRHARADDHDDDAEHGHAGKDAGRVERALGLRDHVAQTARRAQILSHNRAHHRESEAGLQAGEDPGQRARDRARAAPAAVRMAPSIRTLSISTRSASRTP